MENFVKQQRKKNPDLRLRKGWKTYGCPNNIRKNLFQTSIVKNEQSFKKKKKRKIVIANPRLCAVFRRGPRDPRLHPGRHAVVRGPTTEHHLQSTHLPPGRHPDLSEGRGGNAPRRPGVRRGGHTAPCTGPAPDARGEVHLPLLWGRPARREVHQ